MSDKLTWTTEKRRLGDLIEWDRNPRTLSKHDAEHIKRSLDTFGLADPLIINRDNHLIGGHQRKHILADPDTVVDVRVPSRQLTQREAEELGIRLNKAQGDWDFDVLANNWEMETLEDWGFSAEELTGLDFGAGEAAEDPGAQVDKAEELREKWGVQSGQLWQLGEHRLICGDCTEREVVARLMGKDRAEMVWTDPPYGVAVGDKNKFLNSIARSNRIEENLENDCLDEPGLTAMLCAAFDNAIAFCLPGAAWHVAAPAGPLHVLFGQVLKDRGIWRQTIQWVKNNATFAPLGVCYHWRCEPIFFGWLPNAAHRFYGGRKQDTVWEIDRPTKSPEHPTMKPVELVERAIENHTKKGEIVLDVFCGSGTTIIACEHLERIARAVEISPAYVAVALDRWATMTGKTPVLIA